MRLVLFTDSERAMLEAILRVAADTEECQRIRAKVEHALTVRIPPLLRPTTAKAQGRGDGPRG